MPSKNRAPLKRAASEDDLPPVPDSKAQKTLSEMKKVVDRHDERLRILFQLTTFVSLVRYKPEEAAKDKSAHFENFKLQYDLWEAKANAAESRVARKRVQNLHEAYDDFCEKSEQLHQPPVKNDTKRQRLDKPTKNNKTTAQKASKPAEKIKRESTVKSAESHKRHKNGSVAEPAKPKSKPAKTARKSKVVEPPKKAIELDRDVEVIDDDPEYEGLPRVKRLRFRQVKKVDANISVSHPSHYTKPQYDGNIDELLNSYHILDDENQTITYDEYVAKEVAAHMRIKHARQSGLLQELQEMGIGEIDQSEKKFVDPVSTDQSYLTKLLGHVTYLARLRSNLRRNHQTSVKRAAQAVEQYFRRLEGAEEKERKDQERLLRQLARRLGQMVLKKWKLAEKVVEQRRQAALAEEHREKGKEYLNQILEQSSKLIESRVASLEGGQDKTKSQYGSDLDSGADSDASLDDNSLSDAQPKSEANSESDSDSELTVEQLREKYKSISSLSPFPENNDESSSDLETERSADTDATPNLDLEKPSEELLRLYENEKVDFSESSEAESQDDSDSDPSSEDDSEDESSVESPTGTEELIHGSDEATNDRNGNESTERKSTLASLFSGPLSGSDSEFDVEASEDSASEDSQEKEESPNLTEVTSTSSQPATNGVDQGAEEDTKGPSPDSDGVQLRDNTEDTQTPESEEVSRNHIDVPFLFRGTLREYQRKGLDWLAGLYNSQTNAILADEMGLGKTIQTIALLAWLACEKQVWGPHLIIVPTSVMLNWEMEFKRFCPGFKVLTYFGNPQQRKRKRRGWNKEDTWHVCITSYQLVIQDQIAFRGKRWQYMILDEAHNIKNFRSQRWQALLNFNTQNRLLLTGTPLQNNLIELWSLLYFLMPSSRRSKMPDGFASLEDFQEWFTRPVDQMVEDGEEADDEARATISKLHKVLRPYLLRRLKADVEKQMPGKYEHIVYCKLSKRQRYLYDDFMARGSTKATLSSGNYMSILNCLMQLRKVCNHPDLFEVRPIVTSFEVDKSVPSSFESVAHKFTMRPRLDMPSLDNLSLIFSAYEDTPKWQSLSILHLNDNESLESALADESQLVVAHEPDVASVEGWAKYSLYKRRLRRVEQRQQMLHINKLRTRRVPLYGSDCRNFLRLKPFNPPQLETDPLVTDLWGRETRLKEIVTRFCFVTPVVVCLDQPRLTLGEDIMECSDIGNLAKQPDFHEEQVRLSIAFPDKRLLQFDCGKLQKMAILMHDLISKGHRALIFTQMTKVLDILEQFLNLHGWRYLRLDGATRIEQRQALTERFNKDPSIPVFILSTRSGGLGINLTGADTVIFYDSDWNPAMDRQCQDRCHRIGQTRDVHIYRLVSEFTIESNILRKASQKTILDNVVIQEGDFTTEYLSRMSVRDILGENAGRDTTSESLHQLGHNFEAALAQAEDADDRAAAKVALTEAKIDDEEFSERNASPSVAATPGSIASGVASPSSTPAPEGSGGADESTPSIQIADGDMDSHMEVDGEIGHIDDFMIRAIERGLYL